MGKKLVAETNWNQSHDKHPEAYQTRVKTGFFSTSLTCGYTAFSGLICSTQCSHQSAANTRDLGLWPFSSFLLITAFFYEKKMSEEERGHAGQGHSSLL